MTGSFPTRVIAVLPLRGLRAALADRFTERERQRVQEVWVSLVGRVHEAARPLFRHAVFNHDLASPLRQLDVAVAVVRRALGIPPSAAGNRTSHAARHTPPEFAEAILLADQLRMALFLSALGEFSMYYEPWLVDVASSPRLVRSVFAGCVCEPFGRWGAESLGWYYPLSRIFLDYCTLREVERAAFRYASLPPKVARRYLLHSAQILAREQRGPHTEADLGVKVYFADVGGDTFAFSGPAERHAASALYECALGPGDHTATRPGGVSILSFFEVSKRLGRAFAVLESGRCVSRAEFLYRRALGQTEEPPGWYREAEQNVTASR